MAHVKKFVLRLYVGGVAPASTRAVVNARKLCERELGDDYQLEVLDVRSHVRQAREDQVLAIPTLIKLAPLPVRVFIGDLSDDGAILRVLGVRAASAGTATAAT